MKMTNSNFATFKKKKELRRVISLLFLFLLTFPFVFGQSQKIIVTGIVSDENGPIPGVNVFIKGTTNGTITDMNGFYSIPVTDNKTILEYSFIGYKTDEEIVGDRTKIDVVLSPDNQSLEEVIVTGYGTNKRKNLTSAVAQIDDKAIVTTQATSIAQKLSGKVAGLNIRQNTGEPGSYNNSINIRGFGQPIFVIDGIIRNNAAEFQRLNSEDIESITVLKDASAAIYGINAANGVIIVTTKSGKKGKVSFSYNGVVGFSSPTDVPEMANAVHYLEMRNDANIFAGLGPFISREELDKWREGIPGYESVDWYDATFNNNSFRQEHNISATGGSEKVQYHVNLGFVDDGSILKSKDLNYNRFNFRSNLTAKLTKNFTTHVRISGFSDKKESPYADGGQFFSIWRGSVSSLPVHSIYANNNPDYLNRVTDGQSINPVALQQKDLTGYARTQNQIIQTSFDLVYDAPFLKGLQFKILGSYDQTHNYNKFVRKDFKLFDYDEVNDKYLSTKYNYPPGISDYRNYDYNFTFQGHARYKKTFNEKHNLGAFFVYEVRERKRQYASINKYYDFFTNDQLDYAIQRDQVTGGNTVHERFISYIGRINYDYLGKYLIEFTTRYDGSYRYDPSERWGLFPVVSGGWRISEESFIKDNLSWLSNLKLRASWGITGQDAGAPFQYIPGFSVSGGGWWAFENNVITNGVSPPALVNKDLTWMESKTIDLGIDIGLFNNKFSFVADVYKRDRTGLLATRLVTLPNTFGGVMPQENLNSDRVKGIELSFAYNDNIGLFNFSLSGNVNFSRSMNLDVEEAEFQSSWDKYRRGQSDRLQGAVWMYNEIGQFQNYEDVLHSPIQDGSLGNAKEFPGDFKYEDLNGDGVIDGNDIKPMTFDQNPRTYYGLTFACNWKGIDLNVLFQGAGSFSARYTHVYTTMFWLESNLPEYFYNRWHKEDPYDENSEWVPGKWPASRRQPDVGMLYAESDVWRRNATYLRFKNLELGYTIPKRITQKGGLDKVRLFVNGNNLYTWTDPFLKPFDPESNTSPIGLGTGWTYPIMRTFNIGLNVNF